MNDNWPSLQYLDDVDKGGVADMAGLKKGDFLLEVCSLMDYSYKHVTHGWFRSVIANLRTLFALINELIYR